MITRLLFADRDLEVASLPEPDADLVIDLELERLFAAMAGGDEAIDAVVRRVVPLGVRGGAAFERPPRAEAIARRQAVVADALASPATVRELYRLATAGVEAERRVWGGALRNAELVLHRSVEVVAVLLGTIEAMRDVLARDRATLSSDPMAGLADRLSADVDEAFLRAARELLDRLGDRTLVVTAGLGAGSRAAGFTLRRGGAVRARLRDRVGLGRAKSLPIDVTLHDQNAMNALAELRAQAFAPAAAAVADSAGHLLGFCRRLRDEMAFLVGCVNLRDALRGAGVELAMPGCARGDGDGLTAEGLVDPCLALATGGGVAPNDVDSTGCPLTVVTGANGGGKSTLLRAIGVAQLLLNAGMPVPARAMRAAPADGVRVHFPRGEAGDGDAGRLDAELGRLGALVDRVRPGTLVLLNEPLAAVNERDASVIAGELTRGLVAGGATVWLVTHHHELAANLHARPPAPTRFLRAARGEGGTRPFRVEPAPPLATSFGEDLWVAEVEAAAPARDSSDRPPASTIE